MSVIGQVIGNYRIVSELGKGGMGMVYRAEHVQLGRPAALKMLLPQFSNNAAIVQRFFNEAKAASAIDHPGIVEVYDFGTHTDGAAYIVMALLKGESLEHRLQRGPLPPLEGAAIVAQVLGGLAAAHARGIVHRDLKPDNIYLVPNELMPGGIQIKLLDFGIAKLADDGSSEFKTQTGMMMGTPAYMSPEQCMGKSDLDHRTDLYSIGCILFHLLTGRPPFLSDQGTGMMIASHIRDPAPHPRSINPNIPDNLAAIVLRLLEKEPAARYQTALEVRDALTAVGAGAPSRPPAHPDQFAATMAPMQSFGPTGPPAPMGPMSAMGPMGAMGPPTPMGAMGPPTPMGAMGPTMTTASGAAAQVVPLTQPPTGGSKAGVFIGVGLLLAAIGGVAVYAAMSGKDDKPATTASTTPAEVAPAGTPTPTGAATPAAPAAAPPEPTAKPSIGEVLITASAEPCPLGQIRGLDTADHCCWPEQAWSSSKNRCVGAPKCPPGHKATGEDCTMPVAAASPPQQSKHRPQPHGGYTGGSPPPPPPPPPPPSSGPAPSFTLAKAYPPGASIQIKFASAVTSPPNNRSWITIVEADKPPTQYGAWTYIEDGATSAVLTAPANAGDYEVRLHTDYPQKSTNVRRTVAVKIKAAAAAATPSGGGGTPRSDQRFMLAVKAAQAGEKIEITFPVTMKAATGEKFWVTVVQKGASDTSYAAWGYVPDGARAMEVEMPKAPGDYEIRLHANYPTQSTNLVHRARIRVED